MQAVLPRTAPRWLSGRLQVLRRQQQRCLSTPRPTPDFVRVIEVGPRDGLQNEKKSISVGTKLDLINRLAGAGLQTIEAGSFVSPKWVPQMAASDEIMRSILSSPPSSSLPITYQWLLPNMRGLETFTSLYPSSGSSSPAPENDSGPSLNTSSADPNVMPTNPSPTQSQSMPSSPAPENDQGPSLNTSSADPNAMPTDPSPTSPQSIPPSSAPRNDHGPSLNTSSADPNAMPTNPSPTASQSIDTDPTHEISIFLAATDSFSKRNTNCTIAESLERFAPLMSKARSLSIPVRAYISVALGCPIEGPDVPPARVAELAASLLEMGADEIAVADTTGMGTAPKTRELLRALESAGIKAGDLALHFHDTFGQALMNVLVGLEHGVRTFDSAVGGLGGCPYSPGATGNVSTEDLVYTLHALGAETGVDLEEVSRIGEWISGQVGRENESRAGKGTLGRLRAMS